jgi:Gas vesicle synthesis protein GvpO
VIVDVREPDDRNRRSRERDDRRAGRPEEEERDPRERGRRPSRSAGRTARLAADYVAEMTGKEPEGVTSLEQTDDGGWVVGVEVVETRRIPDSTDILAVYEAELDPEGELLAYRRVKRYSRCQVGER